jgi:hypothetical protein
LVLFQFHDEWIDPKPEFIIQYIHSFGLNNLIFNFLFTTRVHTLFVPLSTLPPLHTMNLLSNTNALFVDTPNCPSCVYWSGITGNAFNPPSSTLFGGYSASSEYKQYNWVYPYSTQETNLYSYILVPPTCDTSIYECVGTPSLYLGGLIVNSSGFDFQIPPLRPLLNQSNVIKQLSIR